MGQRLWVTRVDHSFRNDGCSNCLNYQSNIRVDVGLYDIGPDNTLYPTKECYVTPLDKLLDVSNTYTCRAPTYGQFVFFGISAPNPGTTGSYEWSIAEVEAYVVAET